MEYTQQELELLLRGLGELHIKLVDERRETVQASTRDRLSERATAVRRLIAKLRDDEMARRQNADENAPFGEAEAKAYIAEVTTRIDLDKATSTMARHVLTSEMLRPGELRHHRL